MNEKLSDEKGEAPDHPEEPPRGTTNVSRRCLPERRFERLTRPLVRFLEIEAMGGFVLLLATAVALVAANSGFAERYQEFWETRLSFALGDFSLDYPLWYWVNDGLMVIFFFVIGLEIKRELVWGELRDPRHVILPTVAAFGGAAAPMGIYLALQSSPPGSAGWAVPMATDIAFVVGALALLGKRVPAGLKVFLLSLAIIDDILAVLVIAIFFTTSIDMTWLGVAGGSLVVIALLNAIGVRAVGVYLLVGIVTWLATFKSGIHPTVAGAVLGLLTPASAWIGGATLLEVLEESWDRLRGRAQPLSQPDGRDAAEDLAFAATECLSPLERLEKGLHPWVTFTIMPIFALANAGVAVEAERLTHPIAIAVALGLVIGKPLGIGLACFICVRLRLSLLPVGVA
ncbi:MAG TPA: Na+/H+ antiporter NhaA, partial [Planctomycetota bacterium]|nr:Na+/H+ antiporter NhaA [Planctomycetota bacterium]